MSVEGLDLPALSDHLEREVGLAGPLGASLISGGRSILTYAVTDGTHRWVLRRPPPGHVLASAHDIGREYRVMKALGGSAVPVPPMVTHCTDVAVTGAGFYLMDFVDGTIHRTPEQLRAIPDDERLVDGLVSTRSRCTRSSPARSGSAISVAPSGTPSARSARGPAGWRPPARGTCPSSTAWPSGSPLRQAGCTSPSDRGGLLCGAGACGPPGLDRDGGVPQRLCRASRGPAGVLDRHGRARPRRRSRCDRIGSGPCCGYSRGSGIYGGRLRNAHQVEAVTANLISANRRYEAHTGIRITDV
ncbi:phosphotransferase family protein [Nocardioides pacificus]